MIQIGGFSFYWRDRLFEWVMALVMLMMAGEMALWPDTIRFSVFRYILTIISATDLGVFFTVFGLLRMAALVANGHWPKAGPRLRALGAGAGALMWGQLGMALFLYAMDTRGIPSLGIPVYLSLVVGELGSAYRAISDARPTI